MLGRSGGERAARRTKKKMLLETNFDACSPTQKSAEVTNFIRLINFKKTLSKTVDHLVLWGEKERRG